MTLQADTPGNLSQKERRIIELLAEGMKNVEIAAQMGTTSDSVKAYLRAIYDRLGLWNRLELAIWALRHEAN